jgi:hypothetical protein
MTNLFRFIMALGLALTLTTAVFASPVPVFEVREKTTFIYQGLTESESQFMKTGLALIADITDVTTKTSIVRIEPVELFGDGEIIIVKLICNPNTNRSDYASIAQSRSIADIAIETNMLMQKCK